MGDVIEFQRRSASEAPKQVVFDFTVRIVGYSSGECDTSTRLEVDGDHVENPAIYNTLLSEIIASDIAIMHGMSEKKLISEESSPTTVIVVYPNRAEVFPINDHAPVPKARSMRLRLMDALRALLKGVSSDENFFLHKESDDGKRTHSN